MANEVDYFEIAGPDPEGAKAFYGGLFDWTFGDASAGAYSPVNGEKGGLWDTTEMGSPSWAIFYVRVDDVATAIDTALGLGGSIAVPLVDNGTIQFAHLIDPAGRRFGVWKPKS